MVAKLTKEEARNQAQKTLSGLDLASISRTINKKLIGLDLYKEANTIGFYSSMPDEVDLSESMKISMENGKKCYLPKINIQNKSMVFKQVTDLGFLQQNQYGILEPNEIEPEVDKIDLLLVPGLSFDCLGYRLGRGGGYYDRFLSQDKYSSSLGIIPLELFVERKFEFLDSWDQQLNSVLTNRNFYNLK